MVCNVVNEHLSLQEFVVKYFDKAYEHLSLRELRDAPLSAISGVSEADAAKLEKAFRIRTVGDLATNKHVLIAQAINAFSKYSGSVLDKKFESAEFKKLRDKPVSAISGISEDDAALLKKALGISTIGDLAESKYVQIAQLATIPISMIELLASSSAQ
jgi:predicted RecB family nuclease